MNLELVTRVSVLTDSVRAQYVNSRLPVLGRTDRQRSLAEAARSRPLAAGFGPSGEFVYGLEALQKIFRHETRHKASRGMERKREGEAKPRWTV